MDSGLKLINQIKDLSNTAKDTVDNIISGKSGLVDNDTETYRLKLCKNCEFYTEQHSRCKKCGCFMQVKIKILVAKCPIGKW